VAILLSNTKRGFQPDRRRRREIGPSAKGNRARRRRRGSEGVGGLSPDLPSWGVALLIHGRGTNCCCHKAIGKSSQKAPGARRQELRMGGTLIGIFFAVAPPCRERSPEIASGRETRAATLNPWNKVAALPGTNYKHLYILVAQRPTNRRPCRKTGSAPQCRKVKQAGNVQQAETGLIAPWCPSSGVYHVTRPTSQYYDGEQASERTSR